MYTGSHACACAWAHAGVEGSVPPTLNPEPVGLGHSSHHVRWGLAGTGPAPPFPPPAGEAGD